jgi:hypothetical protein
VPALVTFASEPETLLASPRSPSTSAGLRVVMLLPLLPLLLKLPPPPLLLLLLLPLLKLLLSSCMGRSLRTKTLEGLMSLCTTRFSTCRYLSDTSRRRIVKQYKTAHWTPCYQTADTAGRVAGPWNDELKAEDNRYIHKQNQQKIASVFKWQREIGESCAVFNLHLVVTRLHVDDAVSNTTTLQPRNVMSCQ